MDNRRLILLLIFSFSVLMLWDAWQKYQHPTPNNASALQTQGVKNSSTPKPTVNLQLPLPTVSNVNQQGAQTHSPAQTKAEAVTEIIHVKTDLFEADITPEGGDIVRLELKSYKSTLDKNKPLVLIDPKHHYRVQTGLIGEGLPNHHSLYKRLPGPTELGDADQLQIRLETTSAQGVKLLKTLSFYRNRYDVEITHEISNPTPQTLSTHAYYQFQRDAIAPEGESRMVSTFTGPAVYTAVEKYQKISFDDILKEKAKFAKTADNGWLAMVQHYFVAAWIPKDNSPREFYMHKQNDAASPGGVISAGLILPVKDIAPGGQAKPSITLYLGPQEQKSLEALAEGLNLVVDYGWLTLIAAPIFWVLDLIHQGVGNWGWAIVLLTIGIKLLFFPLSAASYKSMARMRTLMPRLQQLKERYGEDRQRLNQEMMKLYQTEKINPLGGCLPIVVQIPVFIALYWVLLGAVEMRDAPWLGWITDLSSADPYYVLPIIMMASMVIQTKLNPTPPDPIQAKIMMIMPFVFGIMFFWFPSGLVLYWVVNNILSIAQQWQITRMIEGGGQKTA